MIEETLYSLGLSKEEVEIYLALLTFGALTVSEVSKKSSVKRTYVYKICEDLLKKGLVSSSKKGQIIAYAPASPDYLLSIAEKRKQELENTSIQLEKILNDLKLKYSAVDEKPIVQVYEGIEGLKKIYKNVLDEKEDILLLRSYFDDKRPDLDEIVTTQISKQVMEGIHVRTITPLESTTKEVFLKHDNENLVKRHIIHSTKFELPSQIIVYKDKVAIISLKKTIISTLIDNKDISDTFKMIFEFLWEKTENEHDEIIKKWS